VLAEYPEQADAVKIARDKLAVLQGARRPAEPAERGFRIRKIGTLESLGSPSPDGRLISCPDWDTGDLAVFEVAPGKKRRVTNKGSWDESGGFAGPSVFSPDGESIAYCWWNDRGGFELRISGCDGTTKPRILYSDKTVPNAQPFAWTPDGKSILSLLIGSGKIKPSRITLISASDGAARTLMEFPSGGPARLCLSPDGRWVAFDSPYEDPLRGEGSGKCDLYVLPIDGGRERPLVTHPSDDRLLGWSPDGRWILFSSDRSGNWDAWLQPVEEGSANGEPRLLKRDFGDQKIMPMGFASDGSFFYGVRARHEDVYVVSLDPSTGAPTTRPQKTALRFEGSNGYPCWSPDGTRLAYTSLREQDKSRPVALCVKTMASGEEREFFPEVRNFDTVFWFPDGHSVLCRGVIEPSRLGLFRFDLDSGKSEIILVLDDFGGLHGPVLSSDGRTIFYDLDDFENKIFRVLSYDLETKQKTELIRSTRQILYKDVSPDGRQLAFWERRDDGPCLNVIPSGGGEAKTVLRLEKAGGVINSVAWSPDGRSIYFSRGSGKAEACDVWRVPAAGGQAEKFEVTATGLTGLSFRPDGGELAFMSWTITSEVWVMENFLPADKKGEKK
jgi:Tol biopolymer transport system component